MELALLLALAAAALVLFWIGTAGERPQDLRDDPPTLDTRNHLDED